MKELGEVVPEIRTGLWGPGRIRVATAREKIRMSPIASYPPLLSVEVFRFTAWHMSNPVLITEQCRITLEKSIPADITVIVLDG